MIENGEYKKEQSVIERYYKGEPIISICKNGGKTVYKTLKKYNLPKRKPLKIVGNKKGNTEKLFIYSQNKVKSTMLKYSARKSTIKNNIRYYEIECASCKQYYYTTECHLKKCNNEKKKNICIDCKKKISSKIRSKGKKSKNNTSGYVGVSLVNGKRFIGVSSQIRHEKLTIFKNMYKDETLSQKTVIQAAIDREIFIIEKKLPHTRNFTDEQLFGNMEYLAYKNIDTLKNTLKAKEL